MTSYTVVITEVLEKEVLVHAESEREAEEWAREQYRKGEIVLGADDHVDTEFEVRE